MPKGDDYSRGKIYQLKCLTTGNVYIGSTIQKLLSTRLAGHRLNFKQWKAGKYHFVTSFLILENDNYEITLLESYPCSSCDELHARERYYIESRECINKIVPTRTSKEYYQANKNKIFGYQKQYREVNKEAIKIKMSEYRKQYKEANKQKISDQKKIIFTCECGTTCTRSNKNRHLKSQTHNARLQSSSQEVIYLPEKAISKP